MRYESTTGLSGDNIDELVRRIVEVLETRHPRGRPFILNLSDQVLVTLMLLRQNVSQTTAADIFRVSQSTISRVYRRLMPLLEQVTCLHEPDLAEVSRGRTVLVDGTDVPTGNRKGANENYSGKRKRHGLNIQVACTTAGELMAVSDPMPGCTHDRRAITDTGWEALLDNVNWIADPGYQGTTAVHPTRRKPGRDLTDDRKASNKAISGIRSAVERCIAHLKNWKILHTRYRGRLQELPNVIRIVTRLEFYRLGW